MYTDTVLIFWFHSYFETIYLDYKFIQPVINKVYLRVTKSIQQKLKQLRTSR